MHITYHTETLKCIINDLSELTGIGIAFLDNNFNYIVRCCDDNDYCSTLQKYKLLRKPCHCSDMDILNKCKESRKLESHLCHAGLCDSVMPITKNDITAGYVIFRRIRTKASPPKNQLNADNKALLDELYNKLPYFTESQIACLSDLLPRILFQNAIEIENDELISNIAEYISANIKTNFSIDFLCSKFFISKNKLYEAFHKHFGCTVNEYIINQKIKKASLMLKETKEPIYKIAEEVGIDNYTYFCKLFKKKTSYSPTEYRAK